MFARTMVSLERKQAFSLKLWRLFAFTSRIEFSYHDSSRVFVASKTRSYELTFCLSIRRFSISSRLLGIETLVLRIFTAVRNSVVFSGRTNLSSVFVASFTGGLDKCALPLCSVVFGVSGKNIVRSLSLDSIFIVDKLRQCLHVWDNVYWKYTCRLPRRTRM